jgi:hypothetical protein
MKELSAALICIVSLVGLSCRGPQGPAGVGGDTLTDPRVQPAVVFTLPSSQSTGPYNDLFSPGESYNPHFVVRFNKYMKRESLFKKLRMVGFDQPVTVALLYTIRIIPFSISSESGNDVYDDLFLFTIYDSLSYRTPYYRIGQNYTVYVDGGIEDINGNVFAGGYNFSFTPEPFFRISRAYPENGSTNIGPVYQQPVLYFNSPVDSSILAAVNISPSVAGRWETAEYMDSTRIHFMFDQNSSLQNGTMYTMTVGSTARDKYGNQLPAPFSSSFSTIPFQVSSTYPSDGETRVNPQNPIVVYTTAFLDTSTIRSAFSTSPTIEGTFSIAQGSSSFAFYPLGGMTPSTTYGVSISTNLKSKYGTSLAAAKTFSFTTEGFRVTYTTPWNGQTNVSRYTNISVYFNTPIDTGSVRTAFGIPGVNGSFSLSGSDYFVFSPSSPLTANTNYTATVSTAIRSKSGHYLGSPYTFSFTTGN